MDAPGSVYTLAHSLIFTSSCCFTLVSVIISQLVDSTCTFTLIFVFTLAVVMRKYGKFSPLCKLYRNFSCGVGRATFLEHNSACPEVRVFLCINTDTRSQFCHHASVGEICLTWGTHGLEGARTTRLKTHQHKANLEDSEGGTIRYLISFDVCYKFKLVFKLILVWRINNLGKPSRLHLDVPHLMHSGT